LKAHSPHFLLTSANSLELQRRLVIMNDKLVEKPNEINGYFANHSYRQSYSQKRNVISDLTLLSLFIVNRSKL
jgi:hypothetical protein